MPVDDGWYILNLSEIRWATVPGGGTWCGFGSPDHPSDRIGIGVHILWPGDSPGFYHEESDLEGFLVLSGECIAIVEGEERRMGPWDYLHSPSGTRHIMVGAGDGPCAILMYGTRHPDATILYPVERRRRSTATRWRPRPTRRRGLQGPPADRADPLAVAARAARRLSAGLTARRAASARPASCGS